MQVHASFITQSERVTTAVRWTLIVFLCENNLLGFVRGIIKMFIAVGVMSS